MKFNPCLMPIATALCAVLLFSCSSDVELPPPLGDASTDSGSNNSSFSSGGGDGSSLSSGDGGISSSATANSSSSVLKECEGTFNPANKFCYDGTIYDKCGGVEYNPAAYICTGGVATPAKCNGEGYNPLTQRCQSGIVENKCGSGWYNPANLGCCGSATYSLSTQRCGSENLIENKCGSGWYNPANLGCCGNATYALSTELRCQGNVVETKCGSSGWYNPATKFCFDNKSYDKCGGREYNPETEICSGTTIYISNCGVNLGSLCPGTSWSQVKWNVAPKRENGKVAEGCYWVESWSGNNGFPGINNFLINGKSYSSYFWYDDLNANKIDGGIYIYIPSNSSGDVSGYSNITPGTKPPPLCPDGINWLHCTGMPVEGFKNAAITQPTLTCRNGSASNVSWTGAPAWNNPAVGNYNVSVSATCGSSETLNADCGSLSVVACDIDNDLLTTVCPNVTSSDWKTAIKWNTVPSNATGCYYITSFSTLNVNDGSYKVNGWTPTGPPYRTKAEVDAVVSKLDGGYYIYVDAGWFEAQSVAIGTRPACSL